MARKQSQSMKKVAEGIYRRPSGRYVVPIYDPALGKKVYKLPGVPRGGFATLEEARDFKRNAEQEKQTRGSSRETVRQFGGRWVDDFPRPSESTNIHNRERIQTFVEEFGDRAMTAVTRQDARRWALDNPGTLKAVRAMFTDYVKDAGSGQNPFARLGLPSSDGRQGILVLEEGELARLVELAGELWGDYGESVFGPMIVVAAYAGLRPGELYAMRWPWVDFERDELTVRRAVVQKTGREGPPKGKRGASTITLLPQAAAALRRVPRRADHDYVFTNQSGRPLRQRSHHYYWDPLRKAFWTQLENGRKDEIDPGFDFYELRHFYGTHLANVWELSPFEIADQMRHDDNGFLASKLYVHPQSRDVRARFRRRIEDRQMGLDGADADRKRAAG